MNSEESAMKEEEIDAEVHRLLNAEEIDILDAILLVGSIAAEIPIRRMVIHRSLAEAKHGSIPPTKMMARREVDQLVAEAKNHPDEVMSSLHKMIHPYMTEKVVREGKEIGLKALLLDKPKQATRRTLDEELVMLGRHWASKLSFTDTDPVGLVKQMWEKSVPDERMALSDEAIVSSSVWACSWFCLGLPTVDLHGHKYAAALASTSIGKDLDVRSPWPAFLLRLPVPLIKHKAENIEHDVARVMVHHYDIPTKGLCWSLQIQVGPLTLSFLRQTTDELLSGEDKAYDFQGAFSIPIDDDDIRLKTVISRIVLGTCLAFDESSVGSAQRAGTSNRVPGTEPNLNIFVVGSPIKVDCRSALTDYLQHGKTTLHTVQWLVRGHWRNQPHGSGRSLRKQIWIEPYWKGPEDAPVLSRPHLLKESEVEQ